MAIASGPEAVDPATVHGGETEFGVVVNPSGGSIASRALLLACKSVIGPVMRNYPVTPLTMPVARTVVGALCALRPDPRGVEREQVRLNGFRMEIIRPAGARRALCDGAVMYMHGGGFFLCGLGSHRAIAAAIARRTGLAVVNVEYRQLPGTTIPGSIEDCLSAYRWLLRHGSDPERIVFAGDSAGGYLSFATALRAIDDGLPAPAGLVAMSPLLDLDCAGKRDHVNAGRDAYIPLPGLEKVVHYGATVDGRLDPASSPVNGALAGLPPVLLIVGEDEVLRCDCAMMARRLTAAGVPNSLELWRGQVHAFMSIAPNIPESRVALGRLARFVRARIETQESARTA
jgi:acetyl esterase/lipase